MRIVIFAIAMIVSLSGHAHANDEARSTVNAVQAGASENQEPVILQLYMSVKSCGGGGCLDSGDSDFKPITISLFNGYGSYERKLNYRNLEYTARIMITKKADQIELSVVVNWQDHPYTFDNFMEQEMVLDRLESLKTFTLRTSKAENGPSGTWLNVWIKR